MWAKAPILNSEADRDRFAQDIAINSGSPEFASDNKDRVSNLDKFVANYAKSACTLLNNKWSNTIASIKTEVIDILMNLKHKEPKKMPKFLPKMR